MCLCPLAKVSRSLTFQSPELKLRPSRNTGRLFKKQVWACMLGVERGHKSPAEKSPNHAIPRKVKYVQKTAVFGNDPNSTSFPELF